MAERVCELVNFLLDKCNPPNIDPDAVKSYAQQQLGLNYLETEEILRKNFSFEYCEVAQKELIKGSLDGRKSL